MGRLFDCGIMIHINGGAWHIEIGKSIRIQGYDYSYPGLYFVTICTDEKICHFGDVFCDYRGDEYFVALTNIGKMVAQCWRDIPQHYPNAKLDEWIVMPNHVHGIIEIIDDDHENPTDVVDDNERHTVGADNLLPLRGREREKSTKREWKTNKFQQPIPRSLSGMIRGFKIGVTKWCNQNGYEHFKWQRNFYEQIIRNDEQLFNTRRYISNNPEMWHRDRKNPH